MDKPYCRICQSRHWAHESHRFGDPHRMSEIQRRCVECGSDISHRRPDAKTCGVGCRVKKSRG